MKRLKLVSPKFEAFAHGHLSFLKAQKIFLMARRHQRYFAALQDPIPSPMSSLGKESAGRE